MGLGIGIVYGNHKRFLEIPTLYGGRYNKKHMIVIGPPFWLPNTTEGFLTGFRSYLTLSRLHLQSCCLLDNKVPELSNMEVGRCMQLFHVSKISGT